MLVARAVVAILGLAGGVPPGAGSPFIVTGGGRPVSARPTAAIDPVGRYTLETTNPDGAPITVTARIVKQTDGTLGGQLSGAAIQTVTIRNVRVADSTITFSVTASDEADATIRLVVNGDAVSGEWTMQDLTMKLTGRRVREPSATETGPFLRADHVIVL